MCTTELLLVAHDEPVLDKDLDHEKPPGWARVLDDDAMVAWSSPGRTIDDDTMQARLN